MTVEFEESNRLGNYNELIERIKRLINLLQAYSEKNNTLKQEILSYQNKPLQNGGEDLEQEIKKLKKEIKRLKEREQTIKIKIERLAGKLNNLNF
jgi:seryl-tRNA synthetase